MFRYTVAVPVHPELSAGWSGGGAQACGWGSGVWGLMLWQPSPWDGWGDEDWPPLRGLCSY